MRRRINRGRKPTKMRGRKAKTSKRHDASNTRRHRGRARAGDAADEALSSSEQEFRLLVDAIPTLVWTAGPEGDIEYVNKRVLDYLGATLDEIIGNGWVEKVHPDDAAYKTNTWLANLESETAHDAVCRFRGADGQYRSFAVRGEPLRAGDGRVLRWYGVMIDIDAAAQLQARDSGPGIDPKDLDRVFDAFYTTKSSGVGMGLSICRSIIQAHGGRLWAGLNTPRGAVFRVHLARRGQ